MSNVVVVGDGWAAMGAVAFLRKAETTKNQSIIWIKGSGSRWVAPLPALEASEDARYGLKAWAWLAQSWGIDSGEEQTGSFLREFRNKAFREPVWMKAATPEQRREVRQETLWVPEINFSGTFEARFEKSPWEIEEELRALLAADEAVRCVDHIPVVEVKMEDHVVKAVLLGNGETIPCDRVIFADRWSGLAAIEGIPQNIRKTLSSGRKREPIGVLQAVFTHEPAMGAGLSEGFFAQMNREAGEEFDRHVWGCFQQDGRRSVWTLGISPDEVEDNHEIAKKLRRLKSTLDKMFAGSAWLPEGKADLSSTVISEHVRFEEAALYSAGNPAEIMDEVITLTSKVEGLDFLTDGYGPSWSLHQVGARFLPLVTPAQPDAQAENVNSQPVSEEPLSC